MSGEAAIITSTIAGRKLKGKEREEYIEKLASTYYLYRAIAFALGAIITFIIILSMIPQVKT